MSSWRDAILNDFVPNVSKLTLVADPDSLLSEEGKVFLPTAWHIWDALQTAEPKVLDTLGHDDSLAAFERLLEVADQAGQELFDAMRQEHSASVAREKERGLVAFGSRRKAIERLGLPEVRQYRLSHCDTEEVDWRKELESARQIVPEIRPLLMMRVIKGEGDEQLA